MLLLAGFVLLRTHPTKRSTLRMLILFSVTMVAWSAIGIAVAASVGNEFLVLILAGYLTASTGLAIWTWRVLKGVEETLTVYESEARVSNSEAAIKTGRALAKAVRRWAE